MLKKIELSGKKLFQFLLRAFLKKVEKESPQLSEINKLLLLRLDNRIGNGILLLPLIRAIKLTRPEIQLHILIHYPIAHLFQEFLSDYIDKLYPYNQKELPGNPLRFLKFIWRLKNEKYDMILSSHNPDNFSFSQAILGKFCSPGYLVGFKWKDSPYFYDLLIAPDMNLHYSEVQKELWAGLDFNLNCPEMNVEFSGSLINNSLKQKKTEKLQILFWLGATGKKILPMNLIEYIAGKIEKEDKIEIKFALGPSDEKILKILPSKIRKKTQMLNLPLKESAKFIQEFSLFISADTGPMHLAVALGIPTLSLFLSSNTKQYGYADEIKHFAVEVADKNTTEKQVDSLLRKILTNLRKK